jgi:hypothetical protein
MNPGSRKSFLAIHHGISGPRLDERMAGVI